MSIRIWPNTWFSLFIHFSCILQSERKNWAFLIYPGMRKYRAARPFLRGYPLRVKLTHGHFHSHAHAPMLFVHGAHCTASLWHLCLGLDCASHSKFAGRVSFSHVLSKFLIANQYCGGHFLHAQSWQDCTGCCKPCILFEAQDLITGLCGACSNIFGAGPWPI